MFIKENFINLSFQTDRVCWFAGWPCRMFCSNLCLSERNASGWFFFLSQITVLFSYATICIFPQQQIDDDENVAETILVEIHADNEESFIDKNVTLTIFKIGESPGTD